MLPVGAFYSSFPEFMTRYVLPLGTANPTYRRLDGEITGGNRAIAGVFGHDGRRWGVHADTHFEPLRIAHEAWQRDRGSDPFRREATRAGTCLVLRGDLRALYRSPYKHLYIYDSGPA